MLERVTFGETPKKHHIALRGDGGALRYEHCLTRAGFDGPYTIAYHVRRPHAARPTDAEHGWKISERAPERRLARRHYRTFELSPSPRSPLDARVALLENDDVIIGVVRPGASDPVYFSNADGDDLFYVHAGGGVVRSLLGDLRFDEGDYVCIPKGIVHRFVLDDGKPQYWLSLELSGGVGIPKQWRNEIGQLRMDAPYCHRDFRAPVFRGPLDENIRDVVVKRLGAFHGYRYDESPLDVVGWDGSVYPWAFPILSFQPRVGLVHVPPTWHGTFAARGALVCSFVPRPVDFHPEAVPCPYPHSSIDIDEILFYCKGSFTSRRGVSEGSISHHPPGVPHGPHPGAYEKSIGTTRTDELAVMLDCVRPLMPMGAALAIEDASYDESFV